MNNYKDTFALGLNLELFFVDFKSYLHTKIPHKPSVAPGKHLQLLPVLECQTTARGNLKCSASLLFDQTVFFFTLKTEGSIH